ncbi:MAG: acetyl-CoA synthetase [Nitrospirae bacterium RIFCSPLOWO2_02_42_7]|nr:MAG: acetyl-CoA synthetase [Nitrospirae bacterium RIFCSPLOWO2_02_42_7]OGW57197.1 MAG: acetyl-CoA synthetase [Nitrospirae bacterium RIFCSPHIGHO2_02_FULL_42_12]HAS17950.1 acetyl-CoA synthetase [Nitrospiraceae bacterium]
MADLKKIFSPKTIAVIGASESDGSVGKALTENLLLPNNRKIFPVNPNRKSILGIDSYARIADIPEQIDLAVIATPAQTVPGIIEECGKSGVEGVIIVSAGFKETGKTGEKLEEQIKEIRRTYGMRIIGPNCLGVIRPVNRLNASFLRVHPEPGKIAFISHSGALGSAILDWAINAHIGFSLFVSLGSMIDVDFGDMIDFLGDDPDTKSIMLYMEGIGNARKFMSAARGFARNKPIIILKPGRFTESAKAAMSHTGAMAGDDQVYDAAFKRAGVIRIKGIEDLFNTAEVLHSKNLPKGLDLAVITNAGGAGVIATDSILESGGKIAQLSEDSLKTLDLNLPKYWSKSNPIDVLGDADTGRYVMAVNICINDPNVHGIIIIYTPQGAANPEELAKAIADISKKSYKPIITVLMGGMKVEGAKKITLENNIPTYETPEEAIKTYMYMYRYGKNIQLLYETPEELPVDQAPPKNNLKVFIAELHKEGRTILTEEESKRFLANYGIPVIKPYLTNNPDEAINISNSIGYPVVIKIVSPDITHKSDIGGVVTGIYSDGQLRKEYEGLLNRVREKAGQAKITGISVQKMIEKIDYEIILGAKKDRDFGSVILFGMGGTTTEIFKDISIGIPPLNQTLARRLMEETKVHRMIQGYRGRPPADMKNLEQILVSFSNLIVDFPEISEIDINPLAISNGKGYALDARIALEMDTSRYTIPYQHLVITPYPTRYVLPWRLSDGTDVILRPIRPEDEPLEHEMLQTLSEDTLRGRFFQILKKISHEMLVRFCNIDYDREMAIIAEFKESEKKRIIGIGRLIIEPDFKKSEFAVIVHDEFQGKGMGYKLVDMLIGIAQEKGLGEVYGTVLTDNVRMLRVCEGLGFRITHLPDGISKVRLTLR